MEELLVTYDGSNVMRWWFTDGRKGSDPVGSLTDREAMEWAEKLLEKLGGHWLNFSIEE